MTGRTHGLTEGVELCPGGAAILTDSNTMVVADLHLGCEAALEYRGISIPRVQTRKVGAYLREAIATHSPDELVIAGDLKHNFSRNLTQEWSDVAEFVRTFAEIVRLRVVRGNHDNYLGAILANHGIQMTTELDVGRFTIVHGHREHDRRENLIMGHLHPSITLRDDTGTRVKSQCYLHDPDRDVVILPALSIVSPGVDVIGTTASDDMLPLLSDRGLDDFRPIAFSRDSPLVFPRVGSLRCEAGTTDAGNR